MQNINSPNQKQHRNMPTHTHTDHLLLFMLASQFIINVPRCSEISLPVHQPPPHMHSSLCWLHAVPIKTLPAEPLLQCCPFILTLKEEEEEIEKKFKEEEEEQRRSRKKVKEEKEEKEEKKELFF